MMPPIALSSGRSVVGNELKADGKDLIIVTGANTGGKSTFLRSLGLAHVMMQAGMFVPGRTVPWRNGQWIIHPL